ncbi:hypothetical protein J7S78_14015 [Klebsiella oxytoca]|uniref:Uncharacterized protein n=1 Tax=Klebsiella oxytoca TaxID=571 RepID=A0AAP2FJQ5_KLEOX|nr:hypothetical protein [Klebsiella oxytoca]MBQ0600910.1 hypothetical protein [Klebsiella oxytoca]
MSVRQKCPASLSVGTVLYSALFDICENTGKVTGTIYEEVVRSIQRRRNSTPDSPKFVNIIKKIDGLTWVDTTKPPATRYGKKPPKTEGWAPYISSMCQTTFVLGSDLPPGICTTKLLAIKAAISDLQNDIKWYDGEIAEHKKKLIPDEEHITELLREKGDVEKSLRLAKSYLTKERNRKVAEKK